MSARKQVDRREHEGDSLTLGRKIYLQKLTLGGEGGAEARERQATLNFGLSFVVENSLSFETN